MQNSILIKLFLLLNIIQFYDVFGDLIDSLVEESERVHRQKLLFCHVCHTETNPTCANMSNWVEDDHILGGFSQQCISNQTICQVKMFAYTVTSQNGTTARKIFGVKRFCTSRCEAGCVIMGERIKLYSCSSCCTENNCNTGSGAVRIINSSISSFVNLVFLIPIIIIYFKLT